jgi:hypothetical protein
MVFASLAIASIVLPGCSDSMDSRIVTPPGSEGVGEPIKPNVKPTKAAAKVEPL